MGEVVWRQVFFDKGILSMLYFPDDHKMAVYIPYFVPVLLPLLVGILREGKVSLSRARARALSCAC
jgi:phosphatidylinositol glycan class S